MLKDYTWWTYRTVINVKMMCRLLNVSDGHTAYLVAGRRWWLNWCFEAGMSQ